MHGTPHFLGQVRGSRGWGLSVGQPSESRAKWWVRPLWEVELSGRPRTSPYLSPLCSNGPPRTGGVSGTRLFERRFPFHPHLGPKVRGRIFEGKIVSWGGGSARTGLWGGRKVGAVQPPVWHCLGTSPPFREVRRPHFRQSGRERLMHRLAGGMHSGRETWGGTCTEGPYLCPTQSRRATDARIVRRRQQGGAIPSYPTKPGRQPDSPPAICPPGIGRMQ